MLYSCDLIVISGLSILFCYRFEVSCPYENLFMDKFMGSYGYVHTKTEEKISLENLNRIWFRLKLCNSRFTQYLVCNVSSVLSSHSTQNTGPLLLIPIFGIASGGAELEVGSGFQAYRLADSLPNSSIFHANIIPLWPWPTRVIDGCLRHSCCWGRIQGCFSMFLFTLILLWT